LRGSEKWRLHNEELNNLCSSTNIIRVVKPRIMKWPGRLARMGKWRYAHRVLVGISEEKKPLGKFRRR
jgi:hypothetical protein